MRSIRAIAIALCVSFLMGFSWMHPHHVSVTEMKHNTKENLLEISCKVFSEDIEEAIKKINNVKLDISSKKDSAQVFALLEDYFKKHLIISLDGVAPNPKFLGFERQEDAIWCYLECTDVKKTGKVCVENSILYEYLPEQTSLMHLVTPEGRKSTKLNNPNTKACFE